MSKFRIILIAMLMLSTACAHKATKYTPEEVSQEAYAFRLVADTLRQGGLEILHNIAILNAEGTVLFADSSTEFEPDHFKVVVPDSAQPDNCYLLLLLFDPCEDQNLVLHSSGEKITPLGVFPTDSVPFL